MRIAILGIALVAVSACEKTPSPQRSESLSVRVEQVGHPLDDTTQLDLLLENGSGDRRVLVGLGDGKLSAVSGAERHPLHASSIGIKKPIELAPRERKLVPVLFTGTFESAERFELDGKPLGALRR